MELFYQKYPESYSPTHDSIPPVIIIPGLFGSTANWRSFAKQLGEYYPVIVIDQRNHGESPHAGSHTYIDMVADLLAFINFHKLARVHLCGHSMGGKVAMAFSLLHPERVQSLVVLDIAPVEYTHTHAPFLEKMMALDLSSLASRSEADKLLSNAIPETATRLFLLQSLTGRKGEFSWRLNLPVLFRDMPHILNFPIAELSGLSSKVKAAFISGEKSNYLVSSHHELIQAFFPSARFTVIPNAEHWLDVDQPKAVLRALIDFYEEFSAIGIINGVKND